MRSLFRLQLFRSMLRETAHSYFNAKAIFCLVFFASATDLVWGQTLSSSLSILDETRKTLIGFWSSSAANTTGTIFWMRLFERSQACSLVALTPFDNVLRNLYKLRQSLETKDIHDCVPFLRRGYERRSSSSKIWITVSIAWHKLSREQNQLVLIFSIQSVLIFRLLFFLHHSGETNDIAHPLHSNMDFNPSKKAFTVVKWRGKCSNTFRLN